MRKTILGFLCVLFFAGAAVWAQAVSGTLSGKITNAAGAAVPNAAVTVTEVNTNVSKKVLTGPNGAFSISGLPPGTYRVDVETAGYKRTSQQNIELTAGAPVALNITLEAGNINETVEIQATAPNIQTEDGQLAIALYMRMVQELPIFDRNYQQLVGLQTGVTPPEILFNSATDPEQNRFFSTNGVSPFNLLRQLDGTHNTEPFRYVAIRVTPVEAIEQLNIVTSNFTMQRGFTGGAWVSPNTRGGANRWHASLFEFWSGNSINARNPFATVEPGSKPRFNYNQPGATFGGPIRRDRTFFFGSYQGTFTNGSQTTLSTVPTPSALTGDFSAVPGLTVYNPATGPNGGTLLPFTGNIIPTGSISPVSAAIASFLPAPNIAGFYNNFVDNVPFRNHGNKADARLDQHFSDRLSGFLRYGFTNDSSTLESPFGSIIGSASTNRLLAHNAIANVTYEVKPDLLTDFRFGYGRYDQNLRPWGSQSLLGSVLGTPLDRNLVGTNINGMLPIGAASNLPQNGVDNTFDWVWSWIWHKGKHNIKWGVDIRRLRTDGFTDSIFTSPFGPNGTAYFGPGTTLTAGAPISQFGEFYNSYAGFLLGRPSQVGVSNFVTTPTIRQTWFGGWIGDNFQVGSHFTLELGLRYEAYSPLEPSKSGGAQFFDPVTNTFSYAGIGGLDMSVGSWNSRNFAPRVGFAGRFGNKTVIRGGYSIQYFQVPFMFSGLTAPTFGTVAGTQGTYGSATSGPLGPIVLPGTPPAALVNGTPADNQLAVVPNANLPTPYVQTYNVQVQREFYWSTVLSAGYVGTLGRKLPFFTQLNSGLPGTGIAGLPFASLGRTTSTIFIDDGLTSNYNSLQVQLVKRFAKGMSFLASYTFSRALGFNTIDSLVNPNNLSASSGFNTTGGFLVNPANRSVNYGPLPWDQQSVFNIGHLFELPFGKHGNSWVSTALGGWQLNGIFSWSTGTPLAAVTADPLQCNCPNNVGIASFNGTGPLVSRSGINVLNQSAFTFNPAQPTGNLGTGVIRAPGFRNYNLSLFKNFMVHDKYRIELRGEAYNLTNTPVLTSPVSNLNAPGFGQQTQTVNGTPWGRQVNLGLRLMF